MEQKIYTLGETVFDIMFKDGKVFNSVPGGSMLNASISLARLGLPVSFISEMGRDKIADIIDTFLHNNNIDTSNIYRFDNGHTAIAHAFLDNNNNAQYEFIKQFPKVRILKKDIHFHQGDILLFGSSYALSLGLRSQIKEIIQKAKEAGAIIIYDPNFRKSYSETIPHAKEFIMENMKMADIVKGSNEDFGLIFGTNDPKEVYTLMKDYCSTLVFTACSENVHLFTESHSKQYIVPKITPISTIGAGDNFSVGMIYAISQLDTKDFKLEELNDDSWDQLIYEGIDFSSNVCQNYDNYVSKDFVKIKKTDSTISC